jgi:hypothetical protein
VVKVTRGGVQAYNYPDTLKKDGTKSVTYFVANIAKNLRLQTRADSLSGATIAVENRVFGSLDNQNWVLILKDTTAGNNSATSTMLLQNVYYNYVKVTVKGITSAQNVRYSYKLLIDKD